jgi:phosphate transport system substrate-binding protein
MKSNFLNMRTFLSARSLAAAGLALALGFTGNVSAVAQSAPALPFSTVTAGDANEAKALSAAGSTFGAPLYKAWFGAYKEHIGVDVGYLGNGSGAGVKLLINRQVDLAGSDAPMTDDQIALAKGGDVIQVPTALGAIVMTYNLPGITQKVRFTAETIAGIYRGDIRRWNDSRLVADNPFLASVDQGIITVHRADGSGTTYGFTDYLSSVSSDWSRGPGKNTSVYWAVGVGAPGNKGVAGLIHDNPYSIGYVELVYALQNNLPYGQVKNQAGRFVDPTLESVTAAAASLGAKVPADLRFSVVNAPGDDAYPICTATWLIVYKNQTDAAKATAVARLLWWATHDAQAGNKALGYAPVPAALQAKSDALIRQINVGGKSALQSVH